MSGHYYTHFEKCEISENPSNANQLFARIEIQGDFPSDEDVINFLEKNYNKETKDYSVEAVYNDPMWLTDWNVGNPSSANGCFGLVIAFLSKKIK